MPYILSAARQVTEFCVQLLDFLRRPSLAVVYVFFFFATSLWLSYMSIETIAGIDDPYFHIRFAELLREQGWSALTDFQSIYFSHMGIGHKYLVYYSLLFHGSLMPFTYVTPLALGIKVYVILTLSFSFTVVYFFIRHVSVRWPFFWTLFFVLALMQSGWIMRFFEARPFALSPVWLLLMLYCIHRKRYWWLAGMAGAYFYWHTATFLFPVALAFGYFLFEQFYGKRPDWKLIMFSLGGTLAAVVVAYLTLPGVVPYLRDVIFQVFFDTTITQESGIQEGAEVYGHNLFEVFASFFWLLFGLILLGSYEILRYIRIKRKIQEAEENIDLSLQPLRALLFVATLLMLLASRWSGRFLDYFVFCAFLYIVLAFADVFKFVFIRGIAFRQAMSVGSVIIIVYLTATLSLKTYDTLAESTSYLIAQGSAEWMLDHVEPGKIIFNVDWDSFPLLYYFTGDRYRFVTGLEPRFLYDYNQRLYWLWHYIGVGAWCPEKECPEITKMMLRVRANEDLRQNWYEEQGEKIADTILNDFQSDMLVFSHARRADLQAVVDHSPRFKREYLDTKNSAYAIYRVLGREEK